MNPFDAPHGDDHLVHELQRRGIFRTGYESTTFCGNLGLPAGDPVS